MKIYKVKVNGKTYVVELEAVDEIKSAPVEIPSAAKATDAPAAPVATGEGQDVLSPIQGNVVDVKVKVGDKVKKGDVLMVIEAMKLENDIPSTCDGIVSSIMVSKGTAVTAKQPLVKIK